MSRRLSQNNENAATILPTSSFELIYFFFNKKKKPKQLKSGFEKTAKKGGYRLQSDR